MSDTKDLIERLRSAAAKKWPDPDVARHSLFAEAADAVARLTAEREELDEMLMVRELPPAGIAVYPQSPATAASVHVDT